MGKPNYSHSETLCHTIVNEVHFIYIPEIVAAASVILSFPSCYLNMYDREVSKKMHIEDKLKQGLTEQKQETF